MIIHSLLCSKSATVISVICTRQFHVPHRISLRRNLVLLFTNPFPLLQHLIIHIRVFHISATSAPWEILHLLCCCWNRTSCGRFNFVCRQNCIYHLVFRASRCLLFFSLFTLASSWIFPPLYPGKDFLGIFNPAIVAFPFHCPPQQIIVCCGLDSKSSTAFMFFILPAPFDWQ